MKQCVWTRLKKGLCLLLVLGLLVSLAACAGQTDTAVVKDLFSDLQKVSYSSTYTSLKDNKTNKTDSWRQGMVSGNGLQGFVTSGDPYSDTFIFQNMHFLLPNKNARTCPDTANELETVRRQIIKGQDITDNASYDDVYRYHPGGQLRLAQTKRMPRIMCATPITPPAKWACAIRTRTAPGCAVPSPPWRTAW